MRVKFDLYGPKSQFEMAKRAKQTNKVTLYTHFDDSLVIEHQPYDFLAAAGRGQDVE